MATDKRSDRVIAFIEEFCLVPEGAHVGKPVKLRPWQKRFLRKVYDNPNGTRRAILSMARKNGKTALIAFLLLAHLAGPEAKRNSQLCSTAMSRKQAAIVFNLAAKMIRMNSDLSGVIQIRDSAKELICPDLGTMYQALSADAHTAHGMSPIFSVHDELGQVRGPSSKLYETIESASAAHEQPLSIIISTQAPTDADLLSILIDHANTDADPHTVLTLYAAPEDAGPFSKKAMRAANPALGDFQSEAEIIRQRDNARAMPSQEASYRNLHLNQRVEARSPFVSRRIWQANKGKGEVLSGRVYGGLDLSSTQDLTALILVGECEGVLPVHSTFWLPEEGIAEKSRLDRVPYDVWARKGLLDLVPGRSIDYDFVAHRLREVFDDFDVAAIAFDRWGMRHLTPWLRDAGFTDEELEKFIEFGQGFKDMSPALRQLESDLLNAKLSHADHPVLTMCAANAVAQSDPAGNRKLAKDRSSGRIDGMVALAMARGVMSARESADPDTSVYEERGLLVL